MIQMSYTKRALLVMAAVGLMSFTGCKIKTQTGSDQVAAGAPVAVQAAAAVAPAAVDPAKPIYLQIDALPVRGAADAKVTIVEFSDYECPFCSRVEPTMDELLKAYPNDVRVAFVNHPLGFHKNAMPAAKAAVAAFKQGKFWEMHAALFSNQKNLNEAFFTEQAKKLGLDMARFTADMNSPETANYIEKGMKDAGPMGISGTPSLLINGKLVVGALPLDAFKKEVDAELARANEVAKAKNLSGAALYEELVKTAPKPPADDEEEAPVGRVMVEIGQAPVWGNVDAPVTIVEFTDFECPFCRRGNTTLHAIMEKNPESVRVVF